MDAPTQKHTFGFDDRRAYWLGLVFSSTDGVLVLDRHLSGADLLILRSQVAPGLLFDTAAGCNRKDDFSGYGMDLRHHYFTSCDGRK